MFAVSSSAILTPRASTPRGAGTEGMPVAAPATAVPLAPPESDRVSIGVSIRVSIRVLKEPAQRNNIMYSAEGACRSCSGQPCGQTQGDCATQEYTTKALACVVSLHAGEIARDDPASVQVTKCAEFTGTIQAIKINMDAFRFLACFVLRRSS